MSFKDSGSNLHQDPDLMGAWNLLLIGDFLLFDNLTKNLPKGENGGLSTLLPSLSTLSTAMEGGLTNIDPPLIFLLDTYFRCSHNENEAKSTFSWFHHVVPQLRRQRFYGSNVMEFVQVRETTDITS